MGEFFKSEMVRGDLQKIMDLQEFCMRSMATFPALSPDKKKIYFTQLRKLLEKQQIFHARLRLSDDPEAKGMLDSLRAAVQMFGADPNENIESMFEDLIEKIDDMQALLEAEGG
jgi:hypothetical protein|tara:strand:+ start:3431 stop:3772 length:342 start_codon:yes stop_codon:yes gene_type:complete